MKKYIVAVFAFLLSLSPTLALDTVFDSMDNATEVKLAPAIKTSNNTSSSANEVKVNSTYQSTTSTIKEQKFNNALVNLDDAQVELRQELAEANSRYSEALGEKERVLANCKAIKKEIKTINKKMKNIDKSKKMINKNLETDK